jgi:hypothetical protein
MSNNLSSAVIILLDQSIWETAGNWVLFFLLILVAIVVFYFLWKFPIQYISARKSDLPSKDVLELENDYRSTLAQIVGGLLVLLGLFFTTNEFFNSRRSLELERRSKEAERFNKAIELLAKDDILNQTGGIFALEGIATNEHDDYRWPVVNTFAAYLKIKSPVPEIVSQPTTEQSNIKAASPAATPSPTPSPTPSASPSTTPSPTASNSSRDIIQEILRFIGMEQNLDSTKRPMPLNLSLVNLGHFNMREGHFEFVNFRGVYALSTDFTDASLKGASFQNTDTPYRVAFLKCAIFNGANLEGATFNGANLRGARFNNAIFSKNTRFDQADLTGANFQKADLREVLGLTQTQIDSAMTDNDTKLPPYVQNTDKAKELKSIPCTP